METIDKAANSANEAIDRATSTTNQATEALGEKGEPLKKTEQQLLNNCRNYVLYNPWVTQ